jgi:hypothetical protein
MDGVSASETKTQRRAEEATSRRDMSYPTLGGGGGQCPSTLLSGIYDVFQCHQYIKLGSVS